MSSTDDLTTRARIRDAALQRFGTDGIRVTTLRTIAVDAQVSAGLIVHHFGSKKGLVDACIDYVEQVTDRAKREALAKDAAGQAQMIVHTAEFHPLLRFLIRLLAEDPASAEHLFERLLDDMQGWLELGVESGQIRATDDPQARALMLLSMSAGQLLMADLIAARLGSDPADALVTLAQANLDFYVHGMYTSDDLLTQTRALLRDQQHTSGTTERSATRRPGDDQ